MESILKKYRLKFKRIREEMDKWNDLQSRLIVQFGMFQRSLTDCRKEFYGIVISLEKIHPDDNQLVKGGSIRLTAPQRQVRVGIQPNIVICLYGLKSIYEMHLSDSSDLSAVRQLLIDEPNIPVEEGAFLSAVQYIYMISCFPMKLADFAQTKFIGSSIRVSAGYIFILRTEIADDKGIRELHCKIKLLAKYLSWR